MTKREITMGVLNGQRPPYVPWSFRFTSEARETLENHVGAGKLPDFLDNHFVELGSDIGFFEPLGNDRYQDVFGVVWDRTIDKDIGNVSGQVLAEPTLRGYDFPNPLDDRFFADIPAKLARHPDRCRVFCIGFSLFERAWSLRGIEPLYIDFIENPGFVHELLGSIAEYNIAQVRMALTYDIDAVYFGDDWGQQRGLLMGYPAWKEFVFPVLQAMYGVVVEAGKKVVIHSCGDVDELFDDLVSIGVSCFNPFQPEVMDVHALLAAYRGRLAFWGGLSTQRTLPYGSADEVRAETQRLIDSGRAGGLILSPAHAVEGDVPLENMIAFIETVKSQPGLTT